MDRGYPVAARRLLVVFQHACDAIPREPDHESPREHQEAPAERRHVLGSRAARRRAPAHTATQQPTRSTTSITRAPSTYGRSTASTFASESAGNRLVADHASRIAPIPI